MKGVFDREFPKETCDPRVYSEVNYGDMLPFDATMKGAKMHEQEESK